MNFREPCPNSIKQNMPDWARQEQDHKRLAAAAAERRTAHIAPPAPKADPQWEYSVGSLGYITHVTEAVITVLNLQPALINQDTLQHLQDAIEICIEEAEAELADDVSRSESQFGALYALSSSLQTARDASQAT